MRRNLLVAVICLVLAQVAGSADFATEVMGATFRVIGSATCFVVRREAPDAALYLVTAGHTFGDGKGETMTLILRRALPEGGFEGVEHTVLLRDGERPRWVRHEKHDVGVLRIADALPVPVPALPVVRLADAARLKASGVHLCSPLFVLTYPATLEADKAGLPVARQGIFASPPGLPLATHPTFLADYNAFPGDSGGPVFVEGADGYPLVVGVVSEQHYYDADMKAVFQDHAIRTPLGAVRIVHAAFVLDVVEAAATQGDAMLKKAE